MYDVIIVGAGASGLVCGIETVRRGYSVCIIEQKEKPGKKLYATGNGKCNLGNQAFSLEKYHSVAGSDLIEILSDTFGREELVRDMEYYYMTLGIPCTERQGYIYPRSEQASTVVQALVQNYEALGGSIQCEEAVRYIERGPKGFRVRTEYGEYQSKKIILAAGGRASEKLGSDGSGYKLAKTLGHSITRVVPSLCGLKCKEAGIQKLQGVRAKGTVSIWNKQNMLAEDDGEIQFTQYGVSGIVIFNLARYAGIELDKDSKAEIRIQMNLLKEYKRDELMKEWLELKWLCGSRSCYDILHGYLPEKLADYLLNRSKLDSHLEWKRLTDSQMESLLDACQRLVFRVVGTNGFEQAQVTAGGVPLKEIDLNTMESRCCPGLYLTGELLDIDADCGGYNLMWAWYSGVQAGKSLKI